MRWDLEKKIYKNEADYKEYIYGSADVVGLMCLNVFVKGDLKEYSKLKLAAISLGNSFVFIAMSIGIGFSQAITPLIAEADGAKKDKVISSIFEHSFMICLILGLIPVSYTHLTLPTKA